MEAKKASSSSSFCLAAQGFDVGFWEADNFVLEVLGDFGEGSLVVLISLTSEASLARFFVRGMIGVSGSMPMALTLK